MGWFIDKILKYLDSPTPQSFKDSLNREAMTLAHMEIEKFIWDHKKSGVVFIFTGGGESTSFVDRYIRHFVAKKHKIDSDWAYSHCGAIYWDDETQQASFNHQTYPIFKREYFYTRPITTIICVNNDVVLRYAKSVADKLYNKKNKYGILQLLFMIIPAITQNIISTPIKAGKVCSEAVVNMWYYARNKKEKHLNNIDPNDAHNLILNDCQKNCLLFYTKSFDFRKK